MSDFDAKVARWRRISAGKEAYGDGPPKDQADRYYFDELIYEIIECARRNTREKELSLPSVDTLVSLLGMSPATTILAASVLRPRRLLIVTTDDARDGLNKVHRALVTDTKLLQPSAIEPRRCNPTNPVDIYRVVRDFLQSVPAASRAGAVIDVTGGKKVMSATGALAAWQLDLKLCYIDNVYHEATRQPVPGTEWLVLLDNPLTLFGEQELASARALLAAGAFAAAHQRCLELAARIREPARARLLGHVAGLYAALCDLDLDALPGYLTAVEAALLLVRGDLRADAADRLRAQLAFLRELAPPRPDPAALVLCFFLLGEHYRHVGRRDFAALFFYRTIEGCLARRLEARAAGFDSSAADWSLLSPAPAELLRRFNELGRAVAPDWREQAELPTRVGLLDSALLLSCLDDPLVVDTRQNTPDALRSLRSLAEVRNRSVLAHGYQTVNAEDVDRLAKRAQFILRAFWRLCRPEEDLDARCAELRFLHEGL
jgi:hypothetical protein